MKLMRAGRARWRIGNETFNTLKNQGDEFKHDFGHGEKSLATVFATLMMPAFAIDPVRKMCCPLLRAAGPGGGATFATIRSRFNRRNCRGRTGRRGR